MQAFVDDPRLRQFNRFRPKLSSTSPEKIWAWKPAGIVMVARTPKDLKRLGRLGPVQVDEGGYVLPEELKDGNQRDGASVAVTGVIVAAHWQLLAGGP